LLFGLKVGSPEFRSNSANRHCARFFRLLLYQLSYLGECSCFGRGVGSRDAKADPEPLVLLVDRAIVAGDREPSLEEVASVARMQRGDIGGLEFLVRRFQVEATRASFLIVRDRPLAEDIVAGAFLRAYERIDQFDAARPFRPWFLRAVVNDSLKAAERGMRTVSLSARSDREPTLLTEADGASPEVHAERSDLRRAVVTALEALSPKQRTAVVLHYYLGLSGREIADRTSSPQGTIKRRLHDARVRLRTLLTGGGLDR
jgi:RNA polymerase sigma-70 factor (ECF subfamily)